MNMDREMAILLVGAV